MMTTRFARWRLAGPILLVGLTTMVSVADAADPAATGGVRTFQAATSTGRQGAYFIPSAGASPALPVFVVLHGSGGKGSTALLRLRALAERERFVVVAPDSVSVAGAWLTDPRSPGAAEDQRHVMACLNEVLALGDARVDRRQVLIAGFSVGGGAAAALATREDAFTAFAVLHGHVPTEALGTRRVRGWLSTGDRDRQRPPAAMRALADELTGRLRFPEIDTRVFTADHMLGNEELSALVAWWLRRAGR